MSNKQRVKIESTLDQQYASLQRNGKIFFRTLPTRVDARWIPYIQHKIRGYTAINVTADNKYEVVAELFRERNRMILDIAEGGGTLGQTDCTEVDGIVFTYRQCAEMLRVDVGQVKVYDWVKVLHQKMRNRIEELNQQSKGG